MSTHFEVLLKKAALKKEEIARLKVWLTNYETRKKTLIHKTSESYHENLPSRASNPVRPIISIGFDQDWYYGHLVYKQYDDFPELFDAIHKTLLKRLVDCETALAEIQAKIEAVEELLKG